MNSTDSPDSAEKNGCHAASQPYFECITGNFRHRKRRLPQKSGSSSGGFAQESGDRE